MIDMSSANLGRALRIVQGVSRDPAKVEIGAYTDRTSLEPTPNLEGDLEELVILCALSEESAQIAKELLLSWTNPDVTREDMKQLIKNRYGLDR